MAATTSNPQISSPRSFSSRNLCAAPPCLLSRGQREEHVKNWKRSGAPLAMSSGARDDMSARPALGQFPGEIVVKDGHQGVTPSTLQPRRYAAMPFPAPVRRNYSRKRRRSTHLYRFL